MGPLARLAAVETWARAEYGADMPEALRLALYGDVQPADLVRVGPYFLPRQKVPCHVSGCLDHIEGLHVDEIGDPIWHAGCSKCALQSSIPAPCDTCGGDHPDLLCPNNPPGPTSAGEPPGVAEQKTKYGWRKRGTRAKRPRLAQRSPRRG